MSQPLPIGGYEWVEFNEEDNNDINAMAQHADFIMNLSDDSGIGYILEVDLHYPEYLHSEHSDFPFCAERQQLPKQAFEILNGKASKIPKLLLTLFDKEKYVVHYKMLKLALRHGLILKKIHRILKFNQSLWLKSYIDLNTELRTKADNDFEKSFYKLLNNAIFGKTMENVRSRVDIKLANKWNGKFGARMLIARPNFKRFTIFDEELVAIELLQTHVKMNKPIAVGMSILDISKITMYSFLYDFLKPKYGDGCSAIYSDTDSFILEINTEDFYRDMRENISMFDTSDYPIPNEYGITRENKKIPGLFKDELNGRIITEFAGLRAKCYAIRSLDDEAFNKKNRKKQSEEKKRERAPCGKYYNEDMKKSKGVKKCVVSEKIKFDDYVECIQNNCELTAKQNTIRSIKHNIYTIRQKKIALSPFDDKRYLIKPNGTNTLAWGHYLIDFHEEQQNMSPQ